MTKLISTIILIVLSLSFCYSDNNYANVGEDNTVYVCTGPKAKRYHKDSDCRGLKRCSGDVVKLTKKQAMEKGYTPCKICYQ